MRMGTTTVCRTGGSHRLGAVLILAVTATLGCAADETQDAKTIETLSKQATPLSEADQEKLAESVFRTLVRADEDAGPEFYEHYYKLVMERCPDTKQAHESYWRLTNLYRQAYDEPKLGEIVKILEQFLARYESSTVVSFDKYPDDMLEFSVVGSLHRAYEELGQYDKIAAYYDTATSENESLTAPECFDYATALDESGRGHEALTWYETFLAESEGTQGLEFAKSVAEDRVRELKQP